MDVVRRWQRWQSTRRATRRAGGRDVPVPCLLRQVELGGTPRAWLPGTLELGTRPVWAGRGDASDLVLHLDPATWRPAGWTERDDATSELHDRTMVLRLADGDDRIDIAVSPAEVPAVDACFEP